MLPAPSTGRPQKVLLCRPRPLTTATQPAGAGLCLGLTFLQGVTCPSNIRMWVVPGRGGLGGQPCSASPTQPLPGCVRSGSSVTTEERLSRLCHGRCSESQRQRHRGEARPPMYGRQSSIYETPPGPHRPQHRAGVPLRCPRSRPGRHLAWSLTTCGNLAE